MEAGVSMAAAASATALPDLESLALGLNSLKHNLPVSGKDDNQI